LFGSVAICGVVVLVVLSSLTLSLSLD